MTEQEIIAGVKAGSTKAFGMLYDLYAKKLYSFCIGFTKSEEDSFDIVQEVFMKVWKRRESLDPNKNISSLFFTIAKNDIINSYKKTLNSQIYEDYIIYKNSEAIDGEAKYEFKDYMNFVLDNIKKLPKTQQKCLILSRFEGLSTKQISAMLNIAEGTVRNQISLGSKKLKELMVPAGILSCLALVVAGMIQITVAILIGI